MQIIGKPFINNKGEQVKTIYHEGNPLEDMDGKTLTGAQAFCFYNDKLIIVKEANSHWHVPGGTIEPNEEYTEATVREVAEETNMKVLHQEIIGYQDFIYPTRIIRWTWSFCKVKPIGDFVSDPDGDVLEIKLICPEECRQYWNYGEIGDRLMERAIEMNDKYQNKI